jgi:hypothetical protein
MIHIRPTHHEIVCLTLITEIRTPWRNESLYYPKWKKIHLLVVLNIVCKLKIRVCVREGYRHYKVQLSMQAYKHCYTDLIVVLHLWQYSCGRRKFHVPRRAHVLGPWCCVVGRVDSNALKNRNSFATSRIIQTTALRPIPQDLNL